MLPHYYLNLPDLSEQSLLSVLHSLESNTLPETQSLGNYANIPVVLYTKLTCRLVHTKLNYNQAPSQLHTLIDSLPPMTPNQFPVAMFILATASGQADTDTQVWLSELEETPDNQKAAWEALKTAWNWVQNSSPIPTSTLLTLLTLPVASVKG